MSASAHHKCKAQRDSNIPCRVYRMIVPASAAQHRAYAPQHLPTAFDSTQGFDAARVATVAFLETFRQTVAPGDREMLLMVARTSLRTKLAEGLADQLTAIVADAVLTIQKPDEPIDLYMVRAGSNTSAL